MIAKICFYVKYISRKFGTNQPYFDTRQLIESSATLFSSRAYRLHCDII